MEGEEEQNDDYNFPWLNIGLVIAIIAGATLLSKWYFKW